MTFIQYFRRAAQRPIRCAGAALLAMGMAAPVPTAQAQADAMADTPGRKAVAPARVAVGTDTRSVLAVQREGSQAGKLLQTPGEQAALAHARYLKSFQHPIPERFVGQTSGGGSGIGVVGLTPAR